MTEETLRHVFSTYGVVTDASVKASNMVTEIVLNITLLNVTVYLARPATLTNVIPVMGSFISKKAKMA